ncbi:MAG: hypothetical protein JWO87_1931 [Phycisphaerales bacterium]|nr:hypothetical protein [Phycisphaerales bacterium]
MDGFDSRARIELLEARWLFSAAPTVVTSLPDSFNGFTFVSTTDPDGSPRLTVTGTPGDDVMKVSADTSDPNNFKVVFELNGAVLETKAPYYTWLFGPNATLELDGGAGNDLIVDNLPAGIYRSVQLNGGDGNDTLMGSDSDPTFLFNTGAWYLPYSFSDSLQGGAGNDLLVGGTVTKSVVSGAGDDDIFVGPNMKSLQLGDGHNVVHSFMGLPATHGETLYYDANGNWHFKPYYGDSDLPGHFSPDYYLSASSSTGSSLLLGRVTNSGATPGDRAIDPSGMDPLPSSEPSPVVLVGDVLWINGTAGNDTVGIALDHTGQYLLVDVNGAHARFKASDVAAYAFNAAGGTDKLLLNNKNGPLPITGWNVHTANPDDSVTVRQMTAPAAGDFPEPMDSPVTPEKPLGPISDAVPAPHRPTAPAVPPAMPAAPALPMLPHAAGAASTTDDKRDPFDAALTVDSVNTGAHGAVAKH